MPPDVLENWINGLSVAEQRTIRAARSARLLEEGPGGIMEQSMTTESENRILIEAVRIAAEQIEKLKSGPGGIMELKQTIADKEAELEEDLADHNELVVQTVHMDLHIAKLEAKIERLEQYESMVHYIANDYIELSYEKAQCQRDDWWKRCNKLTAEDIQK